MLYTVTHYRGLEDEFMEVQKYKSEARHRLIDEGYRIWGIIGDQWSSFEGLPVPKRTFKLPNSMYHIQLAIKFLFITGKLQG